MLQITKYYPTVDDAKSLHRTRNLFTNLALRREISSQTSHFTELVIRQHHAEVGHSGSSHTWASLRVDLLIHISICTY